MAGYQKASNPFKSIFVAVALVLGLTALVVLYNAFVKGSTEVRSKAAIEETIYKAWEFNENQPTVLEGWVGNQLASLAVKTGYLWVIINDNRMDAGARKLFGSISNSAFSTEIPSGNKALRVRMAVGSMTDPRFKGPPEKNPVTSVSDTDSTLQAQADKAGQAGSMSVTGGKGTGSDKLPSVPPGGLGKFTPDGPQVSSCRVRPACLDSKPPCDIPEPSEGWCPINTEKFEFSVFYSVVDSTSPARLTFQGVADGQFHDYYLRFPEVRKITINKLQIDFSSLNTINTQVQFDWIRLVGPVAVNPPPQRLWPQRARQLFLNQDGTKFFYRTCDWNYERGVVENCDPASSWREYPVTAIVDPRTLNPGVPRIRDYNVFVFDGFDERGNSVQKIRQSYINDSGTVAYYRTCTWNKDLALPEQCSPKGTPWTAYSLDRTNINIAEGPPYRKFTSFVFDVPRGATAQKIRQILLNKDGTITYYRTCDWDAQRATPMNCNPTNSWNALQVGQLMGPQLNPVNKRIREYSAFIYDVVDSMGTKAQNIRQFFFNDAGNTVYYRTCHWNASRAVAEQCSPANSWFTSSIVDTTGKGNPVYLGYNVFVYDFVNLPVVATVSPQPTGSSVPPPGNY